MPLSHRWTLTRYLIEERRRFPQASGDLNALILDVSLACKAIARIVAFGELGDSLGPAHRPQAGGVNVQGEVQKPLDVLSNEIFIRMNEWNGHLAGMASEEMDEPRQIPDAVPARQVPAGVRPARRLVATSTSTSRWAASSRSCARRRTWSTAAATSPRPTSCSPAPRRSPPATRCTARRRCWC